jgi:hypothetical protein
MGLIINVYRAADGSDCTNNGVSGKFARLTLANVPGPFEATEDAPACVLVRGNLPGTVKIVPADLFDAGRSVMMGGNYGGTSDSRFSEAVEKLLGHRFYGAVAIHDRTE